MSKKKTSRPGRGRSSDGARGGRAVDIGSLSLSLEQVAAVAEGRCQVKLGSTARAAIRRSREFLLKEVESGKTLYGVNTGFGYLSNVKIPSEDLTQLQFNILRSHATGVGEPIPEVVSRAMLVLRAAALAKGHSGVRLVLIEQILDLINSGVTPVVPCQGSVGASGDLAPLAHLALPLIGEGEVFYRGRRMGAATALRRAKITPIGLELKEGLALINGTQFMTAFGVLALLESEWLCDVADLMGGMSLEALRGTSAAYDANIHRVRAHPGQVLVAKRMRKILQLGGRSEISRSHADCEKVQDPYSLRCIPQVHGASRDSLAWVREVLEREVNSVTDNPLVFPSARKVLSGGNFHGQYVSMAMDHLCIAMAELASISEQRIQKLVNPTISDLPTFLTPHGGLHSGLMMVQVAAASVVSENKTLCHPASVDSIPTNVDKEDHVSMGAWASRKARMVVDNCKRVLAMEYLTAAQGIELLRPLKSTKIVERLHKDLRKSVKGLIEDRVLYKDIEAAIEIINQKAWTNIF